MRASLVVGLLLVTTACGGSTKRTSASEPNPADPSRDAAFGVASSGPPSNESTPCIVVQSELGSQPATVEGELRAATSADGKPAVAPLVLRLTQPRCLVGMPRMSFVTEVYVASTGADLRPLVGQTLQITGDVIGGTNDLGGPAVVVLAKDVSRRTPRSPGERLRDDAR